MDCPTRCALVLVTLPLLGLTPACGGGGSSADSSIDSGGSASTVATRRDQLERR